MQIEHIARISLTTGGTSKDKRYFTISYSLLRQIIVYYKRMQSAIPEIFANGGSGKRSIILECGRLCSRSSYYYSIGHGSVFTQYLHGIGNSRSFLAYCYIYAINGIALLIIGFLINYSVYGNSSLTCLTIADDQLTLTSADRNHGIDSLKTCLKSLIYRLSVNNARSLAI